MKTKPGYTSRLALAVVAAFALVSIAACGEYTVPITDQPTRKVDQQLIGDWVTPDGVDVIKIRQLTNSTYIVSYNGVLFRAFHSDFAKIPFLSVQELETENRTYSYVTYYLSPDGNKMYVRMVNEEVIPDDLTETVAVQKLMLKNVQHPALFHSAEEFRRQP